MLLKYFVLVVILFSTGLMARDREGENIVISNDALVLSSGGGRRGDSNNIVIKDGKKCTCCHIEHVEHWGWDAWQPQHWGWTTTHSKKHDHWKRK